MKNQEQEQPTVNEIEMYFATTGTPDFIITMQGGVVRPCNAKKFIETSINWTISHADVRTYDVYFEALVDYYNKVKKARRILRGDKPSN